MLEHSFLMKIDLPINIYVLSKEEYWEDWNYENFQILQSGLSNLSGFPAH